MFNYKLLKIAIFFIYWLGFAPWTVLILQKERILIANSLQDIFLQYTTLLFVLILVYMIVHQVFEYFYIRSKIKRIVRKVTIRHQLKRLEDGEIDLVAAQRLSTFTKLKEPPKTSVKRKGQSIKKTLKQKDENQEEKVKPEKSEFQKPTKVWENNLTKELTKEKEAKDDIKKSTKAPQPPIIKEPNKEPEKEARKKLDAVKVDKKVNTLKNSASEEVVIEMNE
ncbi:hypothetical protein FF38_10817 [Lucilia cuprina]|uniref:Uncharacterized protein n=1 Tax=Lucilia cuprina TaxID=7375 RepID=A0A0L0CNJ6_LUCCU|nr:hypothetical protein CVS40_7876 [Lucilia cuprina]KNC33802.1 hypothetical protein FF38_10817 [Lucilia cuprina]